MTRIQFLTNSLSNTLGEAVERNRLIVIGCLSDFSRVGQDVISCSNSFFPCAARPTTGSNCAPNHSRVALRHQCRDLCETLQTLRKTDSDILALERKAEDYGGSSSLVRHVNPVMPLRPSTGTEAAPYYALRTIRPTNALFIILCLALNNQPRSNYTLPRIKQPCHTLIILCLELNNHTTL